MTIFSYLQKCSRGGHASSPHYRVGLNIKLAKFKGFFSDLDVYSFQIEFENLYKRSTPKNLLPDLLKKPIKYKAKDDDAKKQKAIKELKNKIKVRPLLPILLQKWF